MISQFFQVGAFFWLMAGLPLAYLPGAEMLAVTECVMLEWHEEGPAMDLPRQPRREVFRIQAEDYDYLFPPACTRAYLSRFYYNGKLRSVIEARRAE